MRSFATVLVILSCSSCASVHARSTVESAPAVASRGDGAIVNTLLRAANLEASRAQVASHRGTDARVRDFAATIVREDAQERMQLAAVIPPSVRTEAPTLGTSWQDRIHREVSDLETVPLGQPFDRAWVDTQVDEAERLLHVIDTEFIPQAQNHALREMLVSTVRPIVVDHLHMAETLKAHGTD